MYVNAKVTNMCQSNCIAYTSDEFFFFQSIFSGIEPRTKKIFFFFTYLLAAFLIVLQTTLHPVLRQNNTKYNITMHDHEMQMKYSR